MSQSRNLFTQTIVASAALAEFQPANLDGSATAAGAKCHGVVQQAGAAGEALPLRIHGTTEVVAGGAVANGEALKVDGDGHLIPQGGAGEIVGYACEDAADGANFEMLLAL